MSGAGGGGLGPAQLLEALVRIPSPTGQEGAAVRFLQGQARADGLRVVCDAVGNFIAEAGHGPRLLLFVGHVDTVPGDIPVRVEGGELWGRGSVDAKGPLVAAYCAARRHLGSPHVTVRVVGAVQEEGDSRGALGLDVSRRPDWLVIGEPSGAHGVTLAYKGILRGQAACRQPRRHGAHPGPTAGDRLHAFWSDVLATHPLEDRFDRLQGHIVGLAAGDDAHTDAAGLSFQFRLPPGVAPERLAASLQSIGSRHAVEVSLGESIPAAEASKRTSLVAAFLHGIRKQGAQPRLLRKTGTADFNHLARRLPGVPLLAYGPGDAALDHTPDERISLAELEQAVEVFDSALRQLATLPLVEA